MTRRDGVELFGLAALWGASFLFMRLGASAFGPVTLAWLRVAVACVVLVPALVWAGSATSVRQHWKTIAVVGLLNSALPFLAYSYAAQSITSGLMSIFNATTPLWSALIAWLWLRDRLDGPRVLGLAIGFAGVLWLVWDKASFKPDAGGQTTGLAVLACLSAPLCYGYAASFTKRHLTGVSPIALAAGSQLAATVMLAAPAAWAWPVVNPGPVPWLAATLLGVLCTGVAYIMYFRLLGRIGPSNAAAVTFLVPGFAVMWGWAVLGETLTPTMVGACAVVLVGTSLATGLVRPWGPRRGAVEAAPEGPPGPR